MLPRIDDFLRIAHKRTASLSLLQASAPELLHRSGCSCTSKPRHCPGRHHIHWAGRIKGTDRRVKAREAGSQSSLHCAFPLSGMGGRPMQKKGHPKVPHCRLTAHSG